jgi:hypothetical protein
MNLLTKSFERTAETPQPESFGVEIKWYDPSKSFYLCQALSSGLEYSMISDDNEQATPFMYCKDFIQDAIQGRLLNRAQSVYSFSYDPAAKEQPTLKEARFALGNSGDPSMGEKIIGVLDFLNQFEDKLKFEKTKILPISNPPRKYMASGTWLIIGSVKWLRCPILLSMYTLLVRVGFSHKFNTDCMETIENIASNKLKCYQPQDYPKIIAAKESIKKIIENGDENIFPGSMADNYPEKILISTMHNTCGIIGWSNGATKKIMPSWHKY